MTGENPRRFRGDLPGEPKCVRLPPDRRFHPHCDNHRTERHYCLRQARTARAGTRLRAPTRSAASYESRPHWESPAARFANVAREVMLEEITAKQNDGRIRCGVLHLTHRRFKQGEVRIARVITRLQRPIEWVEINIVQYQPGLTAASGSCLRATVGYDECEKRCANPDHHLSAQQSQPAKARAPRPRAGE